MTTPVPRRCLYGAISTMCAAELAYELALMRIFSITQWHHFAYMIISIAMLGFGAAGTALAIYSPQGDRRRQRWLQTCAASFAFSLPLCYVAGQLIPFETFHLASSPIQLLHLLMLYLVLSLPFFFCAACITLALLCYPRHIGPLYGTSMVGAGAGALLATLALFWVPPASLPALLTLLGMASLWLISKPVALRRQCLLGLALLTAAACSLALPPRISEYKGLAYARQWPDFQQLARARSPMSEITAVASSLIRETPGQLSGYPMSELGPLPEQIALFFDAGSISVINRFDGDLAPFAYLDYVTGALPYQLIENPSTLVIGAGGGTDVLMALMHHATTVTAVEVDPSLFPLMQQQFDAFSGGLYRRADVRAVQAEARHFLQAYDTPYDLIHLSLIDAFASSAAGVHALSENYIYTREALQLYLQRLTPRGVLSITRWIKTPARDTIKLFATAVEALEAEGVADPGAQLLWIRSWNTATVLASRTPWTPGQLEVARRFCEQRGFDLCYAPGLHPEQANRYTILPEPVYYQAAQALLGDQRQAYYQSSLFHIRPATDNSPYFFRFFKWSALRRLLAGMGTEWIPFVEWGYLALLATLLQGGVAALVCILAPLFAFRHSGLTRLPTLTGVAYFGSLGLAYMFVEIACIQKITLFLAYPIYAAAVVLFSFLTCSGLGAIWGGPRAAASRRRHRRCMAGLLAALGFTVLILQFATPLLMSGPGALRLVAALLLPAPLAFLMGIPFPAGLETIGRESPRLIPWAWGVNGVLAVIATPIAMLIAMHANLLALFGAAGLLYLIAGLVFRRL